jgi:hypothetical protein
MPYLKLISPDVLPEQPAGTLLQDLLRGMFSDYFEVTMDSPGPADCDFANQCELLHYLYLYGSERDRQTCSLSHLGKEPFVIHWINRPAQYLRSVLGGNKIS